MQYIILFYSCCYNHDLSSKSFNRILVYKHTRFTLIFSNNC